MIYIVTQQSSLWEREEYKSSTVEESLEWLNKQDEIAVDTETEGLDFLTDKILILQIGNEERQYVIDITTVDIQKYKNLLESKLCILQNAKFDLTMLLSQNIVVSKVYDTYLAERILTTGIDHAKKGLDFLAEHYCGVIMDKSIRTNIKREGLSNRVIEYSAKDVEYLPKIKRKQEKKLKENGLIKTIHLDNKFVVVLSYMEYCGMYLDKNKWEEKCKQDDLNLNKARKALDEFIINDGKFDKYIDRQGDLFDSSIKTTINWDSTKQVIPIMETLGVDTEVKDKSTGGTKKSIDKKVISKYKDLSPLIELYIEYKEYAKVTSTYGRVWYNYIHKDTGRIHSNFTQIMNTGRLSSGRKKNKKRNISQLPNMQNIPADHTRGCFTPEKGNKLIVSDYSGQEQILLANKSLAPNILKFYESGETDMHSFVCKRIAEASNLFPKEILNYELKDIKKNFPKERQTSKSAGFAINYGGQGITIATNIGISKEEGDEIYNAYFKAFPGLKKYFDAQKKLALKNGYIQFNDVSYRKNYIMFFEEFKELEKQVNNSKFWNKYDKNNSEHRSLVRKYYTKKGEIERNALNYPIQGSSADVTKLAMIYFFRYIMDNNLFGKLYMCNVIHDEIVVECKESKAEKVAKILKNCMERAGDKFCKTVPLTAEPCIEDFWNH